MSWQDQGRKEHGEFGHGTSATKDKLPAGSSPAAATSGYIAEHPRQWIDHASVGNGECVALVQQATGAPVTLQWQPGDLVQGNTAIEPGTAIATFNKNGHYVGHAAIYLGQDADGISVIDQWNYRDKQGRITSSHEPSQRIIRFNTSELHSMIDRGESYRIVK